MNTCKECVAQGKKCKECKYEYTRQWRKRNRDRVNASDKKWREKNREKYNESQRKTYAKHIERRRKEHLDYYHKKSKEYGFSLNTLSRNGGLDTVKAVYEKYDHQCSECGKESKLQIHHKDNQGRRNLKQGLKPNNNLNNLIVLCVRCHSVRHQQEKIYG